MLIIQWRRWHTWRAIAGGYMVLALVFGYLAVDDLRLDRPLTLDQQFPSFPGADQSYAVLMRYGKQHPLGRDFHFQPPERIYRGAGVFDPGAPEWGAWLAANRADLEADWRTLAPVWAWWNELNAFDRIGDLTPARIDAELVTFQPIRSLAQHACAIASLQALDGHGDEALATLLPVLQVSRKLEPSSRTLVRLMIARTVERLAVTTADFVTRQTAVSPAAKSRFAAALATVGGEAGARQVFAIEYTGLLGVTADRGLGDFLILGTTGDKDSFWRHPLNLISPLVFNRRHTFNRYAELTSELEDLAARRETAKLDSRMDAFLTEENKRIKNRMGSILMGRMVPTFGKIAENYWKTEDARAAVRARLVAAVP
jgi:hypothetical protein